MKAYKFGARTHDESLNLGLVYLVSAFQHTVGGGLSAASKSTRRNRAAHDGIVAAVAKLGFLEMFIAIDLY
ncbi:hypothetical protein Y032_0180g781 [Ancylostoma ceylanicum]|nr:hypothetical protein Y032_0180g781 [Ancylostoma ceylanicum]